MARLNTLICRDDEDDESDELPELATILQGESRLEKLSSQKLAGIEKGNMNQMSGKGTRYQKLLDNASSKESKSRQQRLLQPLKIAHVNSLLLPVLREISGSKEEKDGHLKNMQLPLRSSPKREACKPIDYSIFSLRGDDEHLPMSDDDESFTDLSGFIVPDSESDEGNGSKVEDLAIPLGKQRRIKQNRHQSRSDDTEPNETSQRASRVANMLSPERKCPSTMDRQSPGLEKLPNLCQVLAMEHFDSIEPSSTLRFSPPRSRKPSRTEISGRLLTPPSSPSKSWLGSPSKKHRIPPSPHRPSIDAFWSQETINDWNDQCSPKKPHRTSGKKKLQSLIEDGDESISPPKSPIRSPTKKEKQAVKAFRAEKASLAQAFLAEVDERITRSQIANLAASTGGIIIVWSKKLSSTAGRANWRREAVRRRNADGTTSETTYRHHASIELAEKVIDCEERLTNVLAHEYCHLANFMISGVKDQPHGKEFKAWAAKVTRAFGDRGVEVTTKHGYDITYKYNWSCDDCGLQYKRHSKSIDPSKHSCGACKGRLVQILPALRKESEYQQFVKANWERVKKGADEGAGLGEINGLLAKEWEAKKAKGSNGKSGAEVIKSVEDNEDREQRNESPGELDEVARKLDFLSLGV